MWVTTPYCQWLLPVTNYGDQFQQWTLFTLKQYSLEGILAKESSTRTKDSYCEGIYMDVKLPSPASTDSKNIGFIQTLVLHLSMIQNRHE